jgi:putative transposase
MIYFLPTAKRSACQPAAIESCNTDHKTGIDIRQKKYLNSIVEPGHRATKRQTRPMLRFNSFWSKILAGVELMRMIRKGQLLLRGESCPTRQFHSLAE